MHIGTTHILCFSVVHAAGYSDWLATRLLGVDRAHFEQNRGGLIWLIENRDDVDDTEGKMITEVYRSIIKDSPEDSLKKIDSELTNPVERSIYTALWNAQNNNIKEARKYLPNIPENELNPQLRSVYFEVQMILANSEKRDIDATALANKAIEVNPESVLAYLYLGLSLRYEKKRVNESIWNFEKVLTVFPEHNGALYALAHLFTTYKHNHKAALDMVNRCRPSVRRNLYRVLIPLSGYSPAYAIYSIILFGLIFARPIPALYTFLGVLFLGLVGEIVTIRFAKSDSFILSILIMLQFHAGFLYLLYKLVEMMLQKIIAGSAS